MKNNNDSHNKLESCERMTLGHAQEIVEIEHMERYKFIAPLVVGKVVGDIACGSGYGSALLAKSGAQRVSGFDISDLAVAYAKANYAANNLHFLVDNAEYLETVDDDTFDLVVSFETIEHLPNVGAYLRTLYRVLRPEGALFVSTPDRHFSTLYYLRGRPNHPFHLREYSKKEFIGVLSQYFRVDNCYGQAYIPHPLPFWPLQVTLKASCYLLRQWGAYKFIRSIYQIGYGLQVQRSAPRWPSLARFWLAQCTKP
ncbi:MAG TPA: class I SAM-dependent methyltransferase [Thermodesulfovibrionales bacterium]|jgi:ubiquinone/menaquinone biosynthesis C-methylase UbiE|nr:class I SAM-dependent methyltransferase [Thermodesulfovibrionales bacterium]